jgi:hypothetical protein
MLLVHNSGGPGSHRLEVLIAHYLDSLEQNEDAVSVVSRSCLGDALLGFLHHYGTDRSLDIEWYVV